MTGRHRKKTTHGGGGSSLSPSLLRQALMIFGGVIGGMVLMIGIGVGCAPSTPAPPLPAPAVTDLVPVPTPAPVPLPVPPIPSVPPVEATSRDVAPTVQSEVPPPLPTQTKKMRK